MTTHSCLNGADLFPDILLVAYPWTDSSGSHTNMHLTRGLLPIGVMMRNGERRSLFQPIVWLLVFVLLSGGASRPVKNPTSSWTRGKQRNLMHSETISCCFKKVVLFLPLIFSSSKEPRTVEVIDSLTADKTDCEYILEHANDMFHDPDHHPTLITKCVSNLTITIIN